MTKTTNILFLIDIQNGFARSNLAPEQGGSLYVPGGEDVGEPAAHLISSLSNAVIVLSQDFHPKDHISFASNHPGAVPFSNIDLKLGGDGKYHAVEGQAEDAIRQTLWLDHCIQGTESALFVEPVMGELPPNLNAQLRGHITDAVLVDVDDRGNEFYVVRKGSRSDVDSYGIVTENDGVTKTGAPATFALIADKLYKAGSEETKIYIGGVATNFCVEFSHNDIYKYLVPELKARGIKAEVHLLTDISRGIPIDVPGGAWPDLAAASNRMAAMGTTETTTDAIIRTNPAGNKVDAGSLRPTVG